MTKPSRLTCPRDVAPEVAGEFRRLVVLMDGRATKGDEMPLLMLATSYCTWRRATAEVARLGNVVMSGGTAIANPSLAVAAQAHRQIVELIRELGLSPASRKRKAPFAASQNGNKLQTYLTGEEGK